MDLTALQHEDPILKVLDAAQERIRDPENWGRRYLYKHGKLCARGAVMAAAGVPIANDMFQGFTSKLYNRAEGYLNAAAVEAGFLSSAYLNDDAGHLPTMAMFNLAIELRLADMMEAAVA